MARFSDRGHWTLHRTATTRMSNFENALSQLCEMSANRSQWALVFLTNWRPNLANVSTNVSTWLHELVQSSGCRLTSSSASSYLIIDIELYIFWERAYVPSWPTVVVHHGRDSCVVECFWDPFELHSSHVVFKKKKKKPAVPTLPYSPYIRYLTALKALPPRGHI